MTTEANKAAMRRYYYKNRERLNEERRARDRYARELRRRGKPYAGRGQK